MLQISALHSHYGLSHVIQGIDIEAAPGEVIGIFGRNGVGKTTLLKTIAGWVKPSQGAIRVGGAALDGLTPDRICHAGVGFVPEDRRIFPGLTVEENLSLGLLQVKGRSSRDEKRAVEGIYDRFHRLGERRHQLGTTLSGGEQQMLAMARVMVGKPRLVLIDEPSEGLAPMRQSSRSCGSCASRARLFCSSNRTSMRRSRSPIGFTSSSAARSSSAAKPRTRAIGNAC